MIHSRLRLRKNGFPQRARAGLAWALLLFLTLQLALALVLELFIPTVRDPVYTFKLEQLRQLLHSAAAGGEHTELVLMLGSSRTETGLHAGMLQQQLGRPIVVYNFGVPAAGPLRELIYLKRLFADGIRPDLLLVEVLPTFLAGQTNRPLEVKLSEGNWLMPGEAVVLTACGICGSELPRERWSTAPIPWYTHRAELLRRIAPLWFPGCGTTDSQGWLANPHLHPSPEKQQALLGNTWWQHGRHLDSFCLRPACCEALRQLVALCQHERIAIRLVVMPEATVLRDCYSPATRSLLDNALAAISHQSHVPFIDARCWIADTDFADGHHLLPDGAMRFTRRLGHELFPGHPDCKCSEALEVH